MSPMRSFGNERYQYYETIEVDSPLSVFYPPTGRRAAACQYLFDNVDGGGGPSFASYLLGHGTRS
ncbi:MAG: hypothetical protein L0220_15010, partial [Acidobacteria bacterium]|nr:hypothetical protein [Acidobacteriota bacterium]